jgi:hypothetical protein
MTGRGFDGSVQTPGDFLRYAEGVIPNSLGSPQSGAPQVVFVISTVP